MAKHCSVTIGIEVKPSEDENISMLGEEAEIDGYDCIISYLLYPVAMDSIFQRNKSDLQRWRENPVFNLDDVIIKRQEDAGYTIGKAYLGGKDIEITDIDMELALRQQISFGSYMSIGTMIFECPNEQTREFSSILNGLLESTITSNMQLVIQTKIVDELNDGGRPRVGDIDIMSTWRLWNEIRSLCGYKPNLCVGLELTKYLPPLSNLSHWFAEQVRYIKIPIDVFRENSGGYPVLPKAQKLFLQRLVKRSKVPITIILQQPEKGNVPELWSRDSFGKYIRYIIENIPENPELDNLEDPTEITDPFADGYEDYLQAPLQPLMDNLDSGTYEVFERDEIKYNQYEKAMEGALSSRSPGKIVVIVVGAGRGPLVSRCLRAAETIGRYNDLIIYAVEKNPSALVTLQMKNLHEWKERVNIIFSDMRQWDALEQADILISELLGSLGDNELSPECLDGAQRFLKSDGISIPAEYSAFITPLQSPRLYMSVNERSLYTNNMQKSRPGTMFETPYVVMLHAVDSLSFQEVSQPDLDENLYGLKRAKNVKSCWSFKHPNKEFVVDEKNLPLTNHHNHRFAQVSFKASKEGVLHGFGGYFECILYGDVGLSTNPTSFVQVSDKMTSWFPLWFPLKTPLMVPKSSTIQVYMWRKSDKRKVWYEWMVDVEMDRGDGTNIKIASSEIHNPGGFSSSIGL